MPTATIPTTLPAMITPFKPPESPPFNDDEEEAAVVEGVTDEIARALVVLDAEAVRQ
jgi:hypothetical protein